MKQYTKQVLWGMILLILLTFGLYWVSQNRKQTPLTPSKNGNEPISEEKREEAFSKLNLKTNTAISSISLEDVLNGGPRKDGIPSINQPKFVDLKEASNWLDDQNLGLIYADGNTTRFYPYAILYFHEIVNDEVNGKNLAVTFCPLCGSALIFDRGQDVFGVSGKLWESNLLMYDHKTETLWSQILGEAVVGDRTGETLELLDSNVISFSDLKATHLDAEVLSNQTGYRRDYGDSPYGNYENNNSLYFPVSKEDVAFPKKELFHVVNVDEETAIGFHRANLLDVGQAQVEVKSQNFEAKVGEDGSITVKNIETEEELPGFVTMWFSLVTHINKEQIIWASN